MPHFTTVSRSPQLQEVPVYVTSPASIFHVHSNGAHAILSPTGQEFTLYFGLENIATYDLPVYAAPLGRMKQVLLTPCTLAADLTIVGGFIAVYFWLPAGAPGLAEY